MGFPAPDALSLLPAFRGKTSSLVASVAAGDIATADTAVSENLLAVGVTDVNDGSSSRGNGARGALGRGISESNSAEVSEGNKAAA